MLYNFTWDPVKAQSNRTKHGVSFEQATEVFKDSLALSIFEDQHSNDEEERWVTLGKTGEQHYLVVVHTFRDEQTNVVTVRIISARPATKHEIKQYQQG